MEDKVSIEQIENMASSPGCETLRMIWNAAIEKAAKEAEYYMDETVPEQIRKLKK